MKYGTVLLIHDVEELDQILWQDGGLIQRLQQNRFTVRDAGVAKIHNPVLRYAAGFPAEGK
jgi:hypothetical protein